MTPRKKYQLRFEDMDFNELVDYWTGRFVLAVGRGNVKTEVSLMLQSAMKMGAENEKERKK